MDDKTFRLQSGKGLANRCATQTDHLSELYFTQTIARHQLLACEGLSDVAIGPFATWQIIFKRIRRI